MTRSLLLAGFLVLGATPLAQAQTSPAIADASPVARASQQTVAVPNDVVQAIYLKLRDRSAETRVEGLQETLQLANASPETPGLTDLIPELFSVMREDTNAMHRIMAAQALVQIGDRATVRQVSRIGRGDADLHVQRMVRLAVTAKTRGHQG